MNKIKLLSFAMSFLMIVGLGSISSGDAVSATSDREGDISKIRAFLHNDQIANSIETEHGVEIEDLMKRVESLSDEQIAELALNTPDVLKLGGDTTNVESKTAEKVSRDWMGFADKWLMIGLIFSVVMVLLVI